jgi:hypothetical protein
LYTHDIQEINLVYEGKYIIVFCCIFITHNTNLYILIYTNIELMDEETEYQILVEIINILKPQLSSSMINKSLYILNNLKQWNTGDNLILQKTTIHKGEEGLCIEWPGCRTFCEIMNNEIDLITCSRQLLPVTTTYTNIDDFLKELKLILIN